MMKKYLINRTYNLEKSLVKLLIELYIKDNHYLETS